MSNVDPIPHGYHSVSPYVNVIDVGAYINFLSQAFNAKKLFSMDGPDGKIGHAEVRIGDSILMLGPVRAENQPSSSSFYLYTEDCDSLYQRALAAGATSIQPLTDHFYGDRSGGVKDPVGNSWWVATRKENVSPEELQTRMAVAPN